jgi:hypothetical protein
MKLAFLDIKMKSPFNLLTARIGLRDLGYHPMDTSYQLDFTDSLVRDPSNVFYGTVGFTERVFKALNMNPEPLGHVPECLQHFAGREIERLTLSETLKRLQTETLFVKPSQDNGKRFTGKVFHPLSMDMVKLSTIDDGSMLLVSPVMDIVSEYRCFFWKKEIVGIKHYHGDFTVFPDSRVPILALQRWKDQPAAGSIDVAVLADGSTVIVECHDVMSLGVYGLDPVIFANMLEARWIELFRQYES